MIESLPMASGARCADSGYAVDWVANGSDADHALTSGNYDLVILDLGLPRLPGLDVLRRLRSRKSTVPVLILTALDGTSDRVKGLDLGADDYMAKPFELPELEARVRALTRRSTGYAAGDRVWRPGLRSDRSLRLAQRRRCSTCRHANWACSKSSCRVPDAW